MPVVSQSKTTMRAGGSAGTTVSVGPDPDADTGAGSGPDDGAGVGSDAGAGGGRQSNSESVPSTVPTLENPSDTGSAEIAKRSDTLAIPGIARPRRQGAARIDARRRSRGRRIPSPGRDSVSAVRILVSLLLLLGCKVKDPPPITEEWTDDFERTSLGANYYATGDGYDVARRRAVRAGRAQPSAVAAQEAPARRADRVRRVVDRGRAATSRSRCSVTATRTIRMAARTLATGYEVIFGGWYNTQVDHRAARRARQRRWSSAPTLKVVAEPALPLADRAAAATWLTLVHRRHDDAVPAATKIRARSKARDTSTSASTTGRPIPGSTTS